MNLNYFLFLFTSELKIRLDFEYIPRFFFLFISNSYVVTPYLNHQVQVLIRGEGGGAQHVRANYSYLEYFSHGIK